RGDLQQYWLRHHPGAQEVEAFVAALEDRTRQAASVRRQHKQPKANGNNWLLDISIADAHVGRYGDNYDTATACDLIRAGVDIAATDAGDVGAYCLSLRGDIWHSDNRGNRTEKSGHNIPTDCGYFDAIDAGTWAIVDTIDALADRGRPVYVVTVPGNHDWHSAQWLARVLAAWYHQDGRVHVTIPGHAGRTYLQHGLCAIGFAHGDERADWSAVMAAEVPTLWGATRHREFHLAHIHKEKQKAPITADRKPGCGVVWPAALCSNDHWSDGAGFVGNWNGVSSYRWHDLYGRRYSCHYSAALINDSTPQKPIKKQANQLKAQKSQKTNVTSTMGRENRKKRSLVAGELR
ncbi:MAG: hypothetical protein MJH10_11350, partial [Epibacterium sp.]|nr:hypothetical protein [Epibacterium sp.]NQX74143.1 hypothetical protein [Epibacterium sp.]